MPRQFKTAVAFLYIGLNEKYEKYNEKNYFVLAKNAATIVPGPQWVPIAAPIEETGILSA